MRFSEIFYALDPSSENIWIISKELRFDKCLYEDIISEKSYKKVVVVFFSPVRLNIFLAIIPASTGVVYVATSKSKVS